jgi:putative ATP-dependent endonuclease of OLD family
MQLKRIDVRNFRSFADAATLTISDGMNALVGPNNCGKSNFFRALRMAHDEAYPFDPRFDIPIQRPTSFPRVALTFQCEGATPKEKALLNVLDAYERSVVPETDQTYAEKGAIKLVVTYRGSYDTGFTRQEYFAARGGNERRGSSDLNQQGLDQLRKIVRFIAIGSGENIEQVLAGEFRNILTGTLRSELQKQFRDADRAREAYVGAIQTNLLAPMKSRIFSITRRLFPELAGVALSPTVEPLEVTLSKVTISLRDAIETDLSQKGTGLAGGVLVALFRYLTEANKESLLFAIEEPETFLHPAAQEALRDDLEALAEDKDVSLLVTTHSPFIFSRSEQSQVIAIEKNPKGVSRIADSAPGNKSQSEVISGLFRDNVLPAMFDRYSFVPKKTKALLLVEGTSDKRFLDAAVDKLGYEERVAGLHIMANTGVDSLIVQAVLLNSEAAQPVWVLTDSDEPGRRARDILEGRFGFKKKDLLEYRQYVGGNLQDTEAEWLFSAKLVEKFIGEYGEDIVLKSKHRHGGEFRYDFTRAGKEQFPDWLEKNGTAGDFKLWQALLDRLSDKLNEL